MIRSVFLGLCIALPAGTVLGAPLLGGDTEFGHRITAPVINTSSETIGHVTVWQGRDALYLDITVAGLSAGAHGMHFHEIGRCDANAEFVSAGGHVDASGRHHGVLHPHGPHDGDLPNLIIPSSGAVRVNLVHHRVRLDSGPSGLRDADGSALIIHVRRDDGQTPPTGGSGPRAACAVIHPDVQELTP